MIVGRSRVQRRQPVGFDFDDFDDFNKIAESPERTTADVTQCKHQGHTTERFDAINGYTNRVIANGTLCEYQETETEQHHTHGAALGNGYLHQQQQGQTQGLDTERFVGGYAGHATTDVIQHAYHGADSEQYYESEEQDADETIPRARDPYFQRKDSLRTNGTANGYHHQQPDNPLHTNGTAYENGYHHHHQRDKSIHIRYVEADIERMAGEVIQETIAEVELSFFGDWINESEENYEMAKKYIRELALDAVSLKSSICCYYPQY
jgi:hypothetical protein